MIGSLKAHLKIWWLSFGWIFKNNIGDLVTYKDRLYTISSYHWTDHCSLVDQVDKSYLGQVKKSEIRKVRTLSNYFGSLRSGLRFYYGYWFSIWSRGL